MRLNYKDCGTIGFTCSTFDLLHAGHITMLEEAKHHCDYLIVGLQNDPTLDRPDSKNPPVQSIIERQIQLAAVKFVDEIIVYNTEQDLVDLLLTLPIDVREDVSVVNAIADKPLRSTLYLPTNSAAIC